MIGQSNLSEEQWEPALKLLRTDHVFQIEDGHVAFPISRALTLTKRR